MIDEKKIQEAVVLFLEGIGEDTTREGLQDTPKRISAMCHELFEGIGKDASIQLSRTFTANNNEMVVEKDISFYSVCEHHFLPFYGTVHIAYIPDGKVVGLSKLARCVEVYARRAQIQEQMTSEIAEDIMKHLKPKGVMVMIEAEHMCMTMRGIKKPGSKTVSYATLGSFKNNIELTERFLAFVK
ncbi:MAG: GTP cyclohydrolase I FolE [Velocimicrobium sp.]